MAAAACAVKRTEADRCPGIVALHRAEDGFLARVRIPGGRIGRDQLVALSRGAALGNGLVELTSRANLQLRGLDERSGGRLSEIVSAAGLLPSIAHDRVRNVIASPLAGRHRCSRASTDAVVDQLDRALCADPALAELPGRILFAVDDGSGLALEQAADVALVALDRDRFQLAIAGRGIAAAFTPTEVAVAAVAVATAFQAERRWRGAKAWRISELDGGPEALAARLGWALAGPIAAPRHGQLSPGRLTQRDGRVALTALPRLGRLGRQQLDELAAIAPEVRIGAGRTVTVPDIDLDAADHVQARLSALGLVLEPGSGWVGLTACAGFGRCRNAGADLGHAIEQRARSRHAGAPAEHWAACERRCGERAGQPVAVAVAGEGVELRVGDGDRQTTSLREALAMLDSERAR